MPSAKQKKELVYASSFLVRKKKKRIVEFYASGRVMVTVVPASFTECMDSFPL